MFFASVSFVRKSRLRPLTLLDHGWYKIAAKLQKNAGCLLLPSLLANPASGFVTQLKQVFILGTLVPFLSIKH
jgi:hypothetical protein